jgi:outer membrane protein assembly factor BamD
MGRNVIQTIAVPALLAAILISSGCRKKAYENPITKDTQQPDKVLFDTAVDDIEHGRYERARLTLQTLMNTYDTSEYLAKAKLAVADSWYREGGARGLAQAEAEYKDFILFYPQMEEAAEAQEKICKMQYQQMDKADRDPTHTIRAQDECRQLLSQFPNSKFVPEAQQLMRNIQEVLGDAEYRVGYFYSHKGSYPASTNRLQTLTDQFPLYSGAADALWLAADGYQRMGDNFENQQAAAYSKLVAEYPLSSHVDEAKSRLKAMGRPIPEVDPVAYAHQKYEMDNRTSRSLMSKIMEPFAGHPNVTLAAKSGTPGMENLHPMIPASVPATAAGAQGTSASQAGNGGAASDVTATTVKDTNLIDTAPNVLPGAPAEKPATPAAGGAAAPAAGTTPAAGTPAAPGATAPAAGSTVKVNGVDTAVTQQAKPQAALPQNHTGKIKKLTPAQQLKLTQKQQEQFKKLAKRQADAQKKAQEAQAKQDKKDADKKKKSDSPSQPPAGTSGQSAAPKQ